MPWPGDAAVVVNVVHVCRRAMQPPFCLDGNVVEFISSQLDSRQVVGDPYPLLANQNQSFQGSLLRGMGFVLTQEEAKELIGKNPQNQDVVQPYLNGQDLNSSPDQAATRWVINFRNWPLDKAKTYPVPFQIVEKRVYPERMDTAAKRKTYEKIWWQFWRPRAELYETIAPLRRVLVRPRVSNTHAPTFLPTNLIFSEATVVFAFEHSIYFAVMQSTIHEEWVRQYASTLKGDVRYSPTDVFDTFPFPLINETDDLDGFGQTYHTHRAQLMLDRQEGLTATYNRFHNPDESATDIARLRKLHVEMDHAVAAAYGWSDLALDHSFHETQQGLRYTISEAARREVLGRLLALNHERYAEEVAAGLHEKRGKKKAARKGAKVQGKTPRRGAQTKLFEDLEATADVNRNKLSVVRSERMSGEL